MKSIEFIGIPSGDNESFCWDVDRATFVRITGEEPDEFSHGFSPCSFRLYPNHLLNFDRIKYRETPCKVSFSCVPIASPPEAE